MRLNTDRETGGMARGRRACRCALVGVCCALVSACATLSRPPGGDALLAATLPLRITRSAPEDSKPSAFPVRVCEATLPAGTIRANIGDRILPIVRAAPRRIVVIGDTGWRMESPDAFQTCNDTAAWPFAQVAAAAAAAAPDLVIHVGDYHYRENACPAGNAGCAGSPWGYGWDAWNESCDRAGQGWWRFLDPRPLTPARDCNDPAQDETGDYSEPYTVPIAADTELIVRRLNRSA